MFAPILLYPVGTCTDSDLAQYFSEKILYYLLMSRFVIFQLSMDELTGRWTGSSRTLMLLTTAVNREKEFFC